MEMKTEKRKSGARSFIIQIVFYVWFGAFCSIAYGLVLGYFLSG